MSNSSTGTISNFRVVGGKSNVTTLTADTLKNSEMTYKVLKAYAWLNLLKDHMKPTKWFKPTKKGTKVDFDIIADKETHFQAVGELKGYIVALNDEYPDLKLEFVEDGGQ